MNHVKLAGWILLIYGFLVILGGVLGHLKTDSGASLITGGIFGLSLVFASFGTMNNRLLSTYFSLILVIVLDAFFTYRWLLTFQFFPSGLMALITLFVLVSLVGLLRKNLKKN